MTTLKLTQHQMALLEEAIRYRIADLHCQRAASERQGLSTASYAAPINEFQQLKKQLAL